VTHQSDSSPLGDQVEAFRPGPRSQPARQEDTGGDPAIDIGIGDHRVLTGKAPFFALADLDAAQRRDESHRNAEQDPAHDGRIIGLRDDAQHHEDGHADEDSEGRPQASWHVPARENTSLASNAAVLTYRT
jgi:hypothetical protein